MTIHGQGVPRGAGRDGHEGDGEGASEEPELHKGAVWVIRASPDARVAATAGQCGLICVWQVCVFVVVCVYGVVVCGVVYGVVCV